MNYKLLILIIFAAAVSACSKEKGAAVPPGERQVEMNFLLPGAETRATVEEDAIHAITILVFDKEGADGKYLYSRHAWKKTDGAYTTTMKIGDCLTVYFAANRAAILDDLDKAGIAEGASTWAEVREALIMDTPDDMAVMSNGLPMWAMITGVKISDQADNHLGTVQLVRSVASIDIYILDNDFELLDGYTVFAADRGYMPYDPAKMITDAGNILRAVAPYSPDGFTTSVDLKYTLQAQDGNNIVGKFYPYENSTPLTGATDGNRPTKVVLRGIWNNPESITSEPTFYPLTLRSESGGQYVKKNVLRNNKYKIVVTGVNGDGYGDLDDAKDSDDVNWDYDVIEWDDNEDGEIMIDGTKYFFRDRSYVTLPRNAGASGRVNIRTNYPLEDIKMKFESAHTASLHPRFAVEVKKKEDLDGAEYDCLLVTALQDYGTSDNPAVLNVSVERISFNIHIRQLDRSPEDWDNGGGWGVIVE